MKLLILNTTNVLVFVVMTVLDALRNNEVLEKTEGGILDYIVLQPNMSIYLSRALWLGIILTSVTLIYNNNSQKEVKIDLESNRVAEENGKVSIKKKKTNTSEDIIIGRNRWGLADGWELSPDSRDYNKDDPYLKDLIGLMKNPRQEEIKSALDKLKDPPKGGKTCIVVLSTPFLIAMGTFVFFYVTLYQPIRGAPIITMNIVSFLQPVKNSQLLTFVSNVNTLANAIVAFMVTCQLWGFFKIESRQSLILAQFVCALYSTFFVALVWCLRRIIRRNQNTKKVLEHATTRLKQHQHYGQIPCKDCDVL